MSASPHEKVALPCYISPDLIRKKERILLLLQAVAQIHWMP